MRRRPSRSPPIRRRRRGSGAREAGRRAHEFSPAEGAPGDVAKVLLSAARSGLRAVHLVAGDPFEHDCGGQGGAGGRPHRRAVRGGPGRQRAGRRRHLRRRAADRRADHRRRRRRARRWTSRRSPRPPAAGSRVTVDAGDLAAVRDGLLAAGRRRHDPGRGDRRRHRRHPVHDGLHCGQLRRGGARLQPAGWC